MKKTVASLRTAWDLYRHHFGGLMILCLIQLAMRLIVLAPCLFLISNTFPVLSILTPVLFILLILPLRQNTAAVFKTLRETNELDMLELISCRDYSKKLTNGFKSMLLLILWALPFLASTGTILYFFFSKIDGFTILRYVMLFGSGSTVTGIKRVGLVYAATLLPFVFGIALHSGRRHGIALHNMKCLKKHHLNLIWVWLIGCGLLLPSMGMTVSVIYQYATEVLNNVINIAMSGAALPAFQGNLIVLGVTFVFLFLPVLPLKSLMTTCRVYDYAVAGKKGHEA